MTRRTYSACIELLFTEAGASAPDRIRRAADAGFGAVEFWSWRTKDLGAIETALAETSIDVVGFVAEPMEPLTDPSRHSAFFAGLGESIEAAQRLGAPYLIAQAGNERPGVPRRDQHDAIAEALQGAARLLEGSGVTLVVEPLNTLVDHEGYYLSSTKEGLDLVESVDRPEVRLLYDLYHSAVMGEDPRTILAGRVPLVGHVHLADAPGRHEPGSGGMDWEARLTWLEWQGYAGHVGLEFTPTGSTLDALAPLDVRAGRGQRPA